ncbi:MAG TPA: Gldg family protein [Gammaproteobacteria bacterium]|nr:Gldg family protein [Gammaproteobacteria bacterium]
MSGARRKSFALGSLAVLLLGFIAAVIASNTLLGGFRLDLTENRLYTLSAGTRSLLSNLSEPINLYYFFSEQTSEDIQILRDYSRRVREILDEFVAESNGSVRLQTIDPQPFSEEEDRAARFGLTDLALGTGGDSIYFGLAATNLIGDEAVIELFDPDEEASLEYDLARLIYSLATPDKPVVGLISGVPMSGGFDPQTQGVRQPWIIDQHIRQLFDVRTLPAGAEAIDEDVSLLWIVHPVDLPEATLYAIDQFVLGGGRALIFVDPLAEVAGSDPTAAGAATGSDLGPLFDAWRIEFDPSRVVADNRYALSVSSGGRAVRHIGVLGLGAEAMAQDEIVSAGLADINLSTAGSLGLAEGAEVTFVPLLQSSVDSGLMPAAQFQFLTDPIALLDSFAPDSEAHVLAARIEGPLDTAYPAGPPVSGDGEPARAPPEDHLASSDESNLIVVADVDILSDRLWVTMQRSIFGQQIASPIANNHDFVANAIANLAGSADLIGLKSRQTYDRPFDRVQALRRDADVRFRATEQRLEAELAVTERRLGELQSAREDGGSLFMTAEQQAELERFRQEQLRIREELRAVQRQLDQSIEGLGTALKLINIVGIPLGLALAAFAAYLLRRPRKKEASK